MLSKLNQNRVIELIHQKQDSLVSLDYVLSCSDRCVQVVPRIGRILFVNHELQTVTSIGVVLPIREDVHTQYFWKILNELGYTEEWWNFSRISYNREDFVNEKTWKELLERTEQLNPVELQLSTGQIVREYTKGIKRSKLALFVSAMRQYISQLESADKQGK